MSISILCREFGMNCPFATVGDTEEDVLESLMYHMRTAHDEELEDWFEVEEFYECARRTIRERAA